jgi:hypothetical protein
VARGPEGGGEAARKLLRDDVVPLVALAGVERLCGGWSMAKPSSSGTLSSPALRPGGSSARN